MAVRTVLYSPQFPAVPWPYPHGGVALNVGTTHNTAPALDIDSYAAQVYWANRTSGV